MAVSKITQRHGRITIPPNTMRTPRPGPQVFVLPPRPRAETPKTASKKGRPDEVPYERHAWRDQSETGREVRDEVPFRSIGVGIQALIPFVHCI
jgi:hypothetical protein